MADNYIIGVDPDADKHGVAIYKNGKLIDLRMMQATEIIEYVLPLEPLGGNSVIFSIEDVMANQFVYTRNQKQSKAAQSKVAMHIGRCQQAQVELMRWLQYHQIPYQLHKPQKGNWSDKRMIFENNTGWTKQSNADTRSAAFFGFILQKS